MGSIFGEILLIVIYGVGFLAGCELHNYIIDKKNNDLFIFLMLTAICVIGFVYITPHCGGPEQVLLERVIFVAWLVLCGILGVSGKKSSGKTTENESPTKSQTKTKSVNNEPLVKVRDIPNSLETSHISGYSSGSIDVKIVDTFAFLAKTGVRIKSCNNGYVETSVFELNNEGYIAHHLCAIVNKNISKATDLQLLVFQAQQVGFGMEKEKAVKKLMEYLDVNPKEFNQFKKYIEIVKNAKIKNESAFVTFTATYEQKIPIILRRKYKEILFKHIKEEHEYLSGLIRIEESSVGGDLDELNIK